MTLVEKARTGRRFALEALAEARDNKTTAVSFCSSKAFACSFSATISKTSSTSPKSLQIAAKRCRSRSLHKLTSRASGYRRARYDGQKSYATYLSSVPTLPRS
ncbi:hypothetical protein [Sulfitobacter sp.]|uniref:hypothetical protein n=1 Tax=Sulfitobacter sp. TaxID=1903071 RepID=UPI003001D5AB